MTTVGPKLAAYLRSQADWREEKANEYSDDVRNARSAESLRELADHVEALPDTDPNLVALARIQDAYGLDVFSPGEEANRMIGQFGFHNAPGDFDDFLSELSAVEVRDEVKQQEDA